VRITTCTVGVFQENSYLLVDDHTARAVLIDPGAEPDRLLFAVRESGATLDAIWVTHAHLDHIGGIAGVKRVLDVPMYMHPSDRPVFDRAPQQAAAYGLPFDMPSPPEHTLAEGDTLTCGTLTFSVHHMPGHAPGHVIFIGSGVMFGGDLLFAGSIGRTDLPLSDPAQMDASLVRLRDFDPALDVYPGHGGPTTLRQEFESNVFLNGATPIVRARVTG